MGYFELQTPVDVTPYPFDFHSHFNGILPLENKVKWNREPFGINNIGIEAREYLSILGLLGGKSGDTKEAKESVEDAHYKLFKMVLALIEKKNPFMTFDMNVYQRGECAAENIYIACCILQYIAGNRIFYDLRDPDIYQITRRLLENKSLESEAAYHIIAYFNKKLFAANKYTPFDDAYWVRSAVTDNKDYADKFNLMSLCYMYASGVRYAQIAVSAKSEFVEKIDTLIKTFENTYNDTGYKLLAQSPAVYSDKGKFDGELDLILALFRLKEGNPKFNSLVGIDLLAPEIKTGLYKEFFDFLLKAENKNVFGEYVGSSGKPSKKAIMHIHCGEGGGNSENNRSLCGYYLCNATHPDMQRLSTALSEYAIKCYRKNVARAEERKRERDQLGKKERDYLEVTTLFDELFQWNNLVIDGLQLHRFDINSPVSRALVAYNGKTNIIHLCDTLDEKHRTFERYSSYYNFLCADDTPFSFRIGHAYYDRSYLNARFPALYYDTNLGSNFITGASGVFDSTQLYKINRGLRHLDGHIDTNLIEEILDSIAYMGDDILDVNGMMKMYELMKRDSLEIDKAIENDGIKTLVNTFLKKQCAHIDASLPDVIKHKLYCAILSIALNWRSFLLGADGQGVEHSDTTIESVRMVFMLAYRLSDTVGRNITADWLNGFSHFIRDISLEYWRATIGPAQLPESPANIYRIERFQGFKAPNSVVLVKATRIP
jgi:hypothetical protein